MTNRVVGKPLVDFFALPTTFAQYAVLEWWKQSLKEVNGKSRLSFPMIARLAQYIISQNPSLKAALQATFEFVFLDEFQDTTAPQYDLVKTTFKGSQTILAAVGDNKQRIMVWAGAQLDVFEAFGLDFQATQRPLISNYRSSPELVAIQHVLAKAIDAGYVPAESKVPKTHDDPPCAVFEFDQPDAEASYLGDLIADLLETYDLTRVSCA